MVRTATTIIFMLVFLAVAYATVSAASYSVQAYPKVVLYSAPWCKSCSAAKDYFVANSIPYVKKDINENEKFYEEMTERYKSQSVPVIVIGRDQKVLRGFVPELFKKAFGEVLAVNR